MRTAGVRVSGSGLKRSLKLTPCSSDSSGLRPWTPWICCILDLCGVRIYAPLFRAQISKPKVSIC